LNFKHKRITILGYGSQGRAQALNLKESGCNVVVGLRLESSSFKKAKKDHISALPISEAIQDTHLICFLISDEFQGKVYDQYVKPALKPGMTLVFAHGFSVVFKLIPKFPPFIDIVLIAPKVSGMQLRNSYLKKEDVTSLASVYQNASGKAWEVAKAYSKAIGCQNMIKSTFREETISNLFGEQTVKCGGVLDLMKLSYETLVKAGISPKVAFIECIQGMKSMIDLVETQSFKGLQKFISPIAYYGGISRGRRLVNEAQKKELKNILKEIKSGQFAKEWMSKNS